MQYEYITNHGVDPMTIPKDAKVLDARMLSGGRTLIQLNRPLTTEELEYYDIKSEPEAQKILEMLGETK